MLDFLASDSAISPLLSALRNAVACLIVLLGVSKASGLIEFPVFGYVVAVLVLSESALGRALDDATSVLLGTLQAAAFSSIVLLIIGTNNVSIGVCLTCIFLKSFIWCCFPNQKPVKKRLAVAITTIVYVNAFTKPLETHPVFFPLKLAFTTAIGTASAIIALIFPVPRLSTYQVQFSMKLAIKLAMENLSVLLPAFCNSDKKESFVLRLRAKSLERAALKAYSNLEKQKIEAAWEPKFWMVSSSQSERLRQLMNNLNKYLIGMNIAIQQGAAAPKSSRDETRDSLDKLCNWSNLFLSDTIVLSSVKPDIHAEKVLIEALQSLQDDAATVCDRSSSSPIEDLRRMFFLFAVKLFIKEEIKFLAADNAIDTSARTGSHQGCKTDTNPLLSSVVKATKKPLDLGVNKQSIIEATKVAVSIVIAVYLGVLYRKDYGYWSTITVALGLFNQRTGTFKNTSLKLQGTALGTVYGLLVALLTHQAVLTTVLAILPWLFLTSFMRQSKLLKLTGSSTAYTSALIIVGRRREGEVQDFAVLRMVLAVLGLGVFMIVEAVVCPRRAPKLARSELDLNLKMIRKFLQMVFDLQGIDCDECFNAAVSQARIEENNIKNGIDRLRQLIAEAKAEPEFWYAPFHDGIYDKLADYQNVILDLASFLVLAMADLRSERVLFVARELRSSQDGLLTSFDRIRQCLKRKSGGVHHTADIESQIKASNPKELEVSLPDGILEEMLPEHSESKPTIGAIGFCYNELRKEANCLKELMQELLLREELKI